MLPLKEYLLKRLSDNYGTTVAVAVAVRLAPAAVVAVALSVEVLTTPGKIAKVAAEEFAGITTLVDA